MNVTHFSTFTYGGAATAARRLHEGLLACGIDSRVIHGHDANSRIADNRYQPLQTKQPSSHPFTQWLSARIRRRTTRQVLRDYQLHWRDRPKDFELFSPARLSEPTHFEFSELATDIVQLHWVSFLIDYPSFFRSIPRRTPIVWTLHDMNPLTGGCHYAAGCTAFQTGCGNCAQLANPARNDASAGAFRLKRRTLRSRNLHVVTPSRWLNLLARQSPVFPRHTTFTVIPYGLDTKAFSPLRKSDAKQKLGLAADARVILFGAEQIENRRKGFQFLAEALAKMGKRSDTVCLLFGESNGVRELVASGLSDFPTIVQTGYLKTAEQKQLVYSAADCFVMPSLEDNQPQTGLEAMACGTPVVAFKAGGIPEYVIEGETGLLANIEDSAELARQIQRLIGQPEFAESLGRTARRMIERNHHLTRQAEEYQQLYARINRHVSLSRQVAPRAA